MDYLAVSKNKKYLMYISQDYSYAILRPLQAQILAHGGEVCWFLEGDDITPEFLASDEKRLLTVKDVKRWKPDATFIPGNIIPGFIPGKKVAVFHGFNSGKLNHRGKEDHFNIRGCFDLYCTQGPNTTLKFKELSKQYGFFKVIETGWPTLDPLFYEIKSNPYISSDPRPTLLICSTFSKRLSLAPKLYKQIKQFSQHGKWRILMQFHPKMPTEWTTQYKALSNENLTFVETDNVLPLLQAADVMLCDTSSILQMFLVQRKPVVTFCNKAPAKHLLDITNANEVGAAIEHALTYPAELINNIEAYCQQLHPYADGKSSERVLAATNELLLNNEKLKTKPLNLIRQFKMRKKLNYWGW